MEQFPDMWHEEEYPCDFGEEDIPEEFRETQEEENMEITFQSGHCRVNWKFGIAIFSRGQKELAKLTFIPNIANWERKQIIGPMICDMAYHLQMGCHYKSEPCPYWEIDDSIKKEEML
jgi:hypothetical protein